MATVKDLANLSNAVYNFQGVDGWEKLQTNVTGLSTGFQAILYENIDSGEIVLAIAGTQESVADLKNDSDIAMKLTPTQFEAAKAYYNAVNAELSDKNKKIDILTGHSLGGAVAADLANKYSVKATTFASPGIGEIIPDGEINPRSKDLIQEYKVTGDPVGEVGTPIIILIQYLMRKDYCRVLMRLVVAHCLFLI